MGKPVRSVLAGLVLALIAAAAVGLLVWHDRTQTAAAKAATAALGIATDANESLDKALTQVQQQNAASQEQVAELHTQLDTISTQQQTAKQTLAKVVKSATPSEQDLLSRKLPDAVLRLLPSAANNSANAPGGSQPSR